MSRVPVFAVVGRLGLPLAAVVTGIPLWSTSTWAAGASGPRAAVSASNQLKAPPAQVIGVAVPSVVFGQVDGLPRTVTSAAYQAVFQVWLAAGSPASAATVWSDGAQVHGCMAVALRPATVNTFHCTVVVAEHGARPVTVSVAASVAGQRFHVSYRHLAVSPR